MEASDPSRPTPPDSRPEGEYPAFDWKPDPPKVNRPKPDEASEVPLDDHGEKADESVSVDEKAAFEPPFGEAHAPEVYNPIADPVPDESEVCEVATEWDDSTVPVGEQESSGGEEMKLDSIPEVGPTLAPLNEGTADEGRPEEEAATSVEGQDDVSVDEASTESVLPESEVQEAVLEHEEPQPTFEEDAAVFKTTDSIPSTVVAAFVLSWLREGEHQQKAASVLAQFGEAHLGLLAEVLGSEDIEALVLLGEEGVAKDVLKRWESEPDYPRHQSELLQWLSRKRKEPVSEPVAHLGVSLASKLAIRQPAAAKAMVSQAREVLNDDVSSHLDEIVERAKVGSVMEGLDADDHEFWEACLSWDGDDPFSWESDGARQRLKRLADCLRGRDESAPLLQEAVPGCWWDEVTKPIPEMPTRSSLWNFPAGLAAGVILAPLAFILAVEIAPEFGLWWRARAGMIDGEPPSPQVVTIVDLEEPLVMKVGGDETTPMTKEGAGASLEASLSIPEGNPTSPAASASGTGPRELQPGGDMTAKPLVLNTQGPGVVVRKAKKATPSSQENAKPVAKSAQAPKGKATDSKKAKKNEDPKKTWREG